MCNKERHALLRDMHLLPTNFGTTRGHWGLRTVFPAGDSNRLCGKYTLAGHILTALIVTDMIALRASFLSI